MDEEIEANPVTSERPGETPVVRKKPGKFILTLTIAPIVGLIAGGYVASALFPSLVKHHPAILIALDPRVRNLVLVATEMSAASYFTIAIFRRFASHPLFFLIGRWYGDAGIRWIEKRSPDIGALVTTIEGWFPRFGWLLCAIYPHPLVCVMAGASKMKFWAFVVYNFAGSALLIYLSWELGDAVQRPVKSFTHFVSRYSIPLTVLSVLLVLYYVWDGHRQGKGKLESVGAIERELEGDNQGE